MNTTTQMKRWSAILWLWSLVLLPGLPGNAQNLTLQQISLPSGFEIQIFAEDVPDARSMSLSPNGTLFVGTRNAGKVYALKDTDQDNR
ncbi:hypothetical protein GF339_17265, partial [candidate division KSB3 bacterium]|nr:hypothetical protein [candidate division KSB3 bacterium]MBD3326338.1 hypothetical protein [candidate division KSB3 bacterium]